MNKPLNDIDIITNATRFKLFLNKYYYSTSINAIVDFINATMRNENASFDCNTRQFIIKTSNPDKALNALYTYIKNHYMQIEGLMINTKDEFKWDDKLSDMKYIVSDGLLSLLFKTSYINNYLYISI
jgi:hypothetical protein